MGADMNTDIKVLILKDPVIWGSETITELNIKKPKIGDIKHMKLEGQTIADILMLASKLSTQSEKMIDMLSIDDGLALTEIVGEFLGGSQKIGSKVLGS
jgi:hypothetical protein